MPEVTGSSPVSSTIPLPRRLGRCRPCGGRSLRSSCSCCSLPVARTLAAPHSSWRACRACHPASMRSSSRGRSSASSPSRWSPRGVTTLRRPGSSTVVEARASPRSGRAAISWPSTPTRTRMSHTGSTGRWSPTPTTTCCGHRPTGSVDGGGTPKAPEVYSTPLMKICVFIDGQNFYRSLLRFDEALRVDYDKLARWITQAVGGSPATFAGAYYYVGVSADAPALVEGFLKGLELRPGYFVKREPRVRRSGRCSACGATYEYTNEERVDTRLVADLIQLAANDAFDAAVLVSGDEDFVPAVEAVNALGKQVWVATWSADELSKDLRVRCFGQIHLSEGIPAFKVERPRPFERAPTRMAPSRLVRPTAQLATGVALERALQ